MRNCLEFLYLQRWSTKSSSIWTIRNAIKNMAAKPVKEVTWSASQSLSENNSRAWIFEHKIELFLLWTSNSDNSSLWIHIWFNFCASSNFDWIWIQLRWSNLSGHSFRDDSDWSIAVNVSANQISWKRSWWDSQCFVIKIFDIHKL